MCIYILPSASGAPIESPYYRAVYLAERTQACLSSSIALKCGVPAANVMRIVRVDSRGLNIVVDDEFVKEMKEGQDMKVELVESSTQMLSPPNSEWTSEVQMENETKPTLTKGWELRLLY